MAVSDLSAQAVQPDGSAGLEQKAPVNPGSLTASGPADGCADITCADEDLLASARQSSFGCPANMACALVDPRALCYLAGFLKEIEVRQPPPPLPDNLCESEGEDIPVVSPHIVLPLRTAPNGNCLVNAVSVAIWGTETLNGYLRLKMTNELEENAAWYIERLEVAHPDCGAKELQEAVIKAQSDSAFLSNLHIIALANVLHRPIILVASRENMQRWGVGYHGMAGTFLPLRVMGDNPPEFIGKKRPIVLSWGSDAHDHYVPLVGMVDAPVHELEGKEKAAQGPVDELRRILPQKTPWKPLGFPVPTAKPLDDGELKDPFCCPPDVPEAWIDAMCRSLGEGVYTGCWENDYKFVNPKTSLNPKRPEELGSPGDDVLGAETETKKQKIDNGSGTGETGALTEPSLSSGGLLKQAFPAVPTSDKRVSEDAAVDAILMIQHVHWKSAAGGDNSTYITALQTLSKMALNLLKIADATPEQKMQYRRISLSNKAFVKRVGRLVGGIEFFLSLGFDYVYHDLAADSKDSALELALHPGREKREIIERVYKHIEAVLKTHATNRT